MPTPFLGKHQTYKYVAAGTGPSPAQWVDNNQHTVQLIGTGTFKLEGTLDNDFTNPIDLTGSQTTSFHVADKFVKFIRLNVSAGTPTLLYSGELK